LREPSPTSKAARLTLFGCPMWLVLCPSNDIAALWAYRGLLARGLAPLELVNAEVLAHALTWEHRVTSNGAWTRITLADGRTLSTETIQGVLNRLVVVPDAQIARASLADRDYARQELHALYMSWLMAIPGVALNRPTGQGLSGAWRHISEWVALAARAGLPTRPYHQSGAVPLDLWAPATAAQPDDTVVSAIVIGERVCGSVLAPAIEEACCRLARLAGVGILGVDLAQASNGDLYFAAASPTPDLRLGGASLLDTLAAELTSRVAVA
jgi:hypothetical protein